MTLLEKLGFRVTKPTVTYTLPPELSAASKKAIADRKALYDKDAHETAELYASWLIDGVFKELLAYHNYKNITWGSRKSARLLNVCRNLLDIEVLSEESELSESDRLPVLRLLMWMSFLVVIPVTRYHLGNDQESVMRSFFRKLLVEDNKVLSDGEYEIVMLGVFEGILVNESNPVLNIFHDALRFEEAQFGSVCPVEWMRTELGKNQVFKVKACKDSSNNLSPDWLIYLQEIKGVDGLVDVSAAKHNASIVDSDGISI